MPALALVLRILALLLAARLLARFVAGLVRGLRPAPAAARPSTRLSTQGDLVRDRVCNTFVLRERALRAVVAGREEHFCSPACRDRALARTA